MTSNSNNPSSWSQASNSLALSGIVIHVFTDSNICRGPSTGLLRVYICVLSKSSLQGQWQLVRQLFSRVLDGWIDKGGRQWQWAYWKVISVIRYWMDTSIMTHLYCRGSFIFISCSCSDVSDWTRYYEKIRTVFWKSCPRVNLSPCWISNGSEGVSGSGWRRLLSIQVPVLDPISFTST